MFIVFNIKISRFFLENSEKLLFFLANPYLLVIIARNSKEYNPKDNPNLTILLQNFRT